MNGDGTITSADDGTFQENTVRDDGYLDTGRRRQRVEWLA